MYGTAGKTDGTASKTSKPTEALSEARRKAVGDHDETPWSLILLVIIVLGSFSYVFSGCVRHSSQIDMLAGRVDSVLSVGERVTQTIRRNTKTAAGDVERAVSYYAHELDDELDAAKDLGETVGKILDEINERQHQLEEDEAEIRRQYKDAWAQFISLSQRIKHATEQPLVFMRQLKQVREIMRQTQSVLESALPVLNVEARACPVCPATMTEDVTEAEKTITRLIAAVNKLGAAIDNILDIWNKVSYEYKAFSANVSRLVVKLQVDFEEAPALLKAAKKQLERADSVKDVIRTLSSGLASTDVDAMVSFVMTGMRDASFVVDGELGSLGSTMRRSRLRTKGSIEWGAIFYRWILSTIVAIPVCMSCFCCLYAIYLEFVWENETLAAILDYSQPYSRWKCMCCYVADFFQETFFWTLLFCQDVVSLLLFPVALLLSLVAVAQIGLTSACDATDLISDDYICTQTLKDFGMQIGMDILRSQKCSKANLLLCDGLTNDRTAVYCRLLAAYAGALAYSCIPRRLLISWFQAQHSVETARLLRSWECEGESLKP